jgi:DNA-binding transcriptional LysR family regulator
VHGPPDVARGCAGHTVIAMHDDTGDIARPWLLAVAAGARFAVRTNGREAMVTMAAAGIGLACLPRILGDAHAGLRRIEVPRPPLDRVLWLGVPRDVRTIPRVRTVIGLLVDEFRRLAPGA